MGIPVIYWSKRLIVGVFVSLLGVGIAWQIWLHHVETTKEPVVLTETDPRIKVFYKDDCPGCQQLFPTLYRYQLFSQGLVFVNLNAPENRKYIQTYGIDCVPTLIAPNARLTGSDKEAVCTFLKTNCP